MAARREALDRILAAAEQWGSSGQGAVVDALEQANLERILGARSAAKVEREPKRRRQSAAVPLQMLTIAQVAATLCVSRRTVEKLVAAGVLPVTRIGRATRIDSDDLSAWVLANKTSGSYTHRTPGGSVARRSKRGKTSAAQDQG